MDSGFLAKPEPSAPVLAKPQASGAHFRPKFWSAQALGSGAAHAILLHHQPPETVDPGRCWADLEVGRFGVQCGRSQIADAPMAAPRISGGEVHPGRRHEGGPQYMRTNRRREPKRGITEIGCTHSHARFRAKLVAVGRVRQNFLHTWPRSTNSPWCRPHFGQLRPGLGQISRISTGAVLIVRPAF